MKQNNIVFIGMDTHKDFFEVAYEEDDRLSQTIHYERISSCKAFTLVLPYPTQQIVLTEHLLCITKRTK